LTGVWNNPLKDFKSNKDPDLKVMLAIGGQDYAIRRANEMMSKNESRQKFVISTTKLLRTHEFDGIDLNFEPSEALGPPSTPNRQLVDDKKRLSILCKVRFIIFDYEMLCID
jgi:GH18 family chitinase